MVDSECRLKELNLNRSNIGDEGAATLAEGLKSNQRLTRMNLANNNITENGWSAFSPIFCDTTSINATHGSNHALQNLGYKPNMPRDVETMLELNSDQDKSCVLCRGEQGTAGTSPSGHETSFWLGVRFAAVRDRMARAICRVSPRPQIIINFRVCTSYAHESHQQGSERDEGGQTISRRALRFGLPGFMRMPTAQLA